MILVGVAGRIFRILPQRGFLPNKLQIRRVRMNRLRGGTKGKRNKKRVKLTTINNLSIKLKKKLVKIEQDDLRPVVKRKP